MSLQYERAQRTVIRGLQITGTHLPWKDKEDSLIFLAFRRFYNFMFHFIVTHQLIVASSSAILHKNFDDKCRSLAMVSIAFSPTMISLYYNFYHVRVKAFLDHSDALNQAIVNSNLRKKERFPEIYQKASRNNNLFTKIMLLNVLWTPFLYTGPRPIMDYKRNQYRKTQAFHYVYPFDVHQPGVYEVFFLLQSLGLLCSNLKKFGNDCFFASLFRTQTAYLKYLSESIRGLGEEYKKTPSPILKKELKEWITIHDYFLRNFNELLSLYTPVICVYYANLICTIVLTVFAQVQERRYGLIEAIGIAGFSGVNTFQLYKQCEINDNFCVEAENLALEIYKTPWHEADRNNIGLIRTMLLVASKPLEVTPFRSVTLRLNKEVFLGFVASTITAVMTFKQMSDERTK